MQQTIDPKNITNEAQTRKNRIDPILQDRWDWDKVVFEYPITAGTITVDANGKTRREKPKYADYLLLYKENIPLAIVEAKDEIYEADKGFSQVIDYAKKLEVPYAYSTNGIDLIEIDIKTGANSLMKLGEFPYMDELWKRYCKANGLDDKIEEIYTESYYITKTGKRPRYYQRNAINKTVLQIMKGQKRILLVMATGTGKTFTAFQIIYRFWKTKQFRKVLFLADRNILVDQTMKKDFKPFMDAMVKIDNNNINTSRDIYLGLYQQLTTVENDYYKQFPPDFFDLICIDECHRGSASVDSNWHDILTYFKSAYQIGMTATPKDGGVEDAQNKVNELKELLKNAQENSRYDEADKILKELAKAQETLLKAVSQSNLAYFGNPVYTYSLKQGIEDGFLAPYKIVNVELNIDKYGWVPPEGMVDVHGNPVVHRKYLQDDFDRNIVVEERRKLVAKRISDFLKANDMRYSKTIVFCENIAHCREMVRCLINENPDMFAEDSRYVVQITGDDNDGKAQLDNFIDPSSKYPVIAVTSRLMSTGVDSETCELIVLDRKIGSMTEFKQIIGRGTRIKEDYDCDGEAKSKMFFTILDFRKNYEKFNDPEFDGEPAEIFFMGEEEEMPKIVGGNKKAETPISLDEKHKANHKMVRVNGVAVEIVNEDILYRDIHGNLIAREDISSCTKNNILNHYATFEEFKTAWFNSIDKVKLASELLVGDEWAKKYKEQFGYPIDEFDIISCLGYDIDPPKSKSSRVNSQSVKEFLNGYSEELQKIAEVLLNAYTETNFNNLREIKEIFAMKSISNLGYTPISAIKLFGGKDKYFKFLNELENKLYQE